MSDSGISWAICKSAPRSRQITMPAPHHSVFYTPDALSAAQPTASKHWRHMLTCTVAIKRWLLCVVIILHTIWQQCSKDIALFYPPFHWSTYNTDCMNVDLNPSRLNRKVKVIGKKFDVIPCLVGPGCSDLIKKQYWSQEIGHSG